MPLLRHPWAAAPRRAGRRGEEHPCQTTSPEKGKKKFKMPNTYVILFGVIFIAVLSWFVPGGAYELNANGDAFRGRTIVESNPQGLWTFMAPITAGMLIRAPS